MYRGIDVEALDTKKRWTFHPAREFTVGSIITGGDIYGMVEENELINHAIMFYPGKSGRITVRSPPLTAPRPALYFSELTCVLGRCRPELVLPGQPPFPPNTSKRLATDQRRETYVRQPTRQWIASIGEYTLNDDVIEIENVAGQKERFTMLRECPLAPFFPVCSLESRIRESSPPIQPLLSSVIILSIGSFLRPVQIPAKAWWLQGGGGRWTHWHFSFRGGVLVCGPLFQGAA